MSTDSGRHVNSVSFRQFRANAGDHLTPARRRALLVLAMCAVAAVYIWLRTSDSSRIVTIDEPVFLAISGNFANAVAHGDFAETDQFLYPAVTIMWAGTFGYLVELPTYVTGHPNQVKDLYSVHGPIRAAGGEPLDVLVAARAAKVVLQAGCFLIAVWLMYRLFGLAIAALAATFIVFDPFLISHDRLLHVDGVTGITAFVSMLAAALADRNSSKGLWVLAGVAAALCWLTRLTGLVLVPILLFVIADGAISRFRSGTLPGKDALGTAAKTAGVVVGASVATTIAMWPALWVDPVGAIEQTLADWQRSIETPHPWSLYFDGKTVEGDPGIMLYVYDFLFKITPFALIGLAVVAVAFLFRVDAIMPNRSWRPVVILTSFVAVYSVGMAAGQRKFDRYILPDFLFMDLLAAIGLVGVAHLIWARPARIWRVATVIVLTGLVAGQVITAHAHRPYMLDYYNPLFGGAKAAEEMVMVGWGEGLDQAARFILAQPDGETAVIRTSMPPTTMLYFLPGTVAIGTLGNLAANQASLQAWANTDYAITHILQWQRDTSGGVVPYLESFQPIDVVTLNGVEFVRVYDLRRIPPPDWMIEQSGCSWSFGGRITLAAYGAHNWAGGAPPGANEQTIELIVQTNAITGSPPAFQVHGVLVSRRAGDAAIEFTTSLIPNAQPGLLAKAVQTVPLPDGKTLRDYWLQTSVIDPATGLPLSAVHLATSQESDRAGRPEC